MDLTSCFGKIKIFFNAKENVTIPQSSSSTLACVDVDTSIAILNRTPTFIMPLLVVTNLFSYDIKIEVFDKWLLRCFNKILRF
jgi:hypothetical protein